MRREERLSLEFDATTVYSLLTVTVANNIIIFHPVECSQGKVGGLVNDSAMRKKLESAARSMMESLTSQERDAFFRVDFGVDHTSQEIQVLKINVNPRVFSPNGVTVDDALVERTVPGGHPALFSFLVFAKKSFDGELKVNQKVIEIYAEYMPIYDEQVPNLPYYRYLQHLTTHFDWTGTVLDLACGTGLLGKLLHEKGYKFKIFGVDLSPDMTMGPSIQKYYQSPVTVGPMQGMIMQPAEYDHVACFGALDYLAEDDFVATLSRMFLVAQRSISFDIEEPSPEYLTKMAEDSSVIPTHNYTKIWKKFEIPAGWKVVYEEYGLLFHDSNQTDCDVFGRMIRLERA